MKPSYIIESSPILSFHKEIMVCNFPSLNKISSYTITDRIGFPMTFVVGFWKLKKKK